MSELLIDNYEEFLTMSEVERKRPIVMKFGGTSVGGAKAIDATSRIVEPFYRAGVPLVVVASAMRGVTDSLLRACHYIESGDQQVLENHLWDIIFKHQEAISSLNFSPSIHQELSYEMEELYLELLSELERPMLMNNERKARIIARGERWNCRIIAAQFTQRGMLSEAVDATDLIETDQNFLDAKPELDKTRIYANRRLGVMIEQSTLPVVTGFIGATRENKITTLGRGGSDYTASILGRVLNAREVWIWTDVDGIYSADPRNNPDAKILPELSFETADRMAKDGAKVLYEKTIEPIADTDIILRVKNTFRPGFLGTRIGQNYGTK